MLQSDYSLSLRDAWASINDFMAETMPGILIKTNSFLDDEDVDYYASEGGKPALIKPFLIVWHRGATRAPRGRSAAGTRLDQYRSGFDISAVANNGDDAVDVANQAMDKMIGFMPAGGGQITQGPTMYEGARAVKSSEERPSRFATMDRYFYSWNAQSVPPGTNE